MLFAVAALPASAHEFWIAPSRYAATPGAPIELAAVAGTGFRGEHKPWSPDRSVRFVIGKAEPGASLNHAWLLWRNEGRWWILDPTNTAAPIAADAVSPRTYVALYSCTATGKYAHGTPSAVSHVAERSSR